MTERLIYDAHMHLDMGAKEPYKSLKASMDGASFSKGMLILNSLQEEAVFWNHKEEIISDGKIGAVAAILDVREAATLRFFEKARKDNLNVAVKLHPRITNIKREDFESIYQALGMLERKNIIVDAFVYGPRLENHVGAELAIYLAERLTDSVITLAHAGGCDILKCMLLTRPLTNIVYDYSLTCSYLEFSSVRADMVNSLRFAGGRIMFGSDFPDFSFERAVQAAEGLCDEARLTQEQAEDVFYNNACRIYGGELKNA